MAALGQTDGNLFDIIAPRSADEQLTEILNIPGLNIPGANLADPKIAGLKIERIVSTGQVTEPGTWLDQAWSEWVLVISGAAKILFEGEAEPRPLKAGDYLLIPPHTRHRVIWTDNTAPTIWLAVHFGEFAAPGDSFAPDDGAPL